MSQNLLTNGDFEQGNNIGFSSNYGFTSGTTSVGQYGIGTDPKPYNPSSFISMGDHTSGSGNMMIVDGTNNGGNPDPFFWRVNNNGEICGLTTGLTYTFSYWIKSIYIPGIPGASVAQVRIKWNNIQVGEFISPVSGSEFAPEPGSDWQKVTYQFVPTNACVRIEMFDQNGNVAGNDFAIDDLELNPPLSISASLSNVTCPGANDGSIVAYGKGGALPYIGYALSGSASLTNTSGIFTGLGPGTYTVSVRDQNNQTISVSSIVITQPADLTAKADKTSVCPDDPVNLSAVNLSATGLTSYSWTASPNDPTLSTPNIWNPVVKPTQTTTYTVKSTINVPSQNLIYNGDFSLGNNGFYTDYKFYTNNPTGLKRAYGIVSNPKTWFNGFSDLCTGNGGSGNMMTFDGSTINDDKVWCQKVPVKTGQAYTFSYFVQSLVDRVLPDKPSANLEVRINGVLLTSASNPQLTPATACQWEERTYTWNSGSSSSAEICIYNREIKGDGNDFALDDISLKTTGTTTCTSSADVTIIVNSCGSCTLQVDDISLSPLCENGSLEPSIPSVTTNGSALEFQGWQIETAVGSGTFNSLSVPYLVALTDNGKKIRYAVKNSCGTEYSNGITLIVNAKPSISLLAGVTVADVCIGSKLQLTGSGTAASSNAWLSSVPAVATVNPSGEVTGVVAGISDITYTNSNGCSETLRITVKQKETPEFNDYGPFCQNAPLTLPILPATSNNGITGTWLPGSLSTSLAGNITYSFTPDATQCALPIIITVVVNPQKGSIFTQIQPICNGSNFNLLATSTNGITGSWSPSYDNTQTTTYTFTPNAGQCARDTTMTVVVNQPVASVFTQIDTICRGGTISLPNISNNGITGNWAPAFNNTQTTTYTFTPDAGQCARDTTMTVAVKDPLIPTFTQIDIICVGETFILPTISDNGITGSWSPSINNTSTTTYTFTPDAGQCATTTTMTVAVRQKVVPVFNQYGPFCQNAPITLPTLPAASNNGIAGTWSPGSLSTAIAGNITYSFTPDATQCAIPINIIVVVDPSSPPPIVRVDRYCQGAKADSLDARGSNLRWYTSPTDGTGNTLKPIPSTQNSATYYVTQRIPGFCESERIPLDVFILPNPVASAGPDKDVIEGNRVQIEGFTDGVDVFWTPELGLSNPRIVNPFASPEKTTVYTMTVKSSQGCESRDQVRITVIPAKPVNIPNVFSPNGDGINDRWVIRNIEEYPDAAVQIFNRYGAQVYEVQGYSNANGWEGKFNGADLPVGPYYYIIRLNKKQKQLAGVISIIR